MDSSPTNLDRPIATPIRGTHIDTFMFERSDQLAAQVAQIIAGEIRQRAALGQQTVIGVATGSTPAGTYRELIRLHREEGLDLSGVVLFLLGEYVGLPADSPQSHARWITEHLTNHVNIAPENIYVPDVSGSGGELEAACRRHEEALVAVGGLDFAICGIGRNGHLAFNEPFSVRNSRTRLCTLDPVTRRAAASDFFGLEYVPTHAVTMGMATLMEARTILLLAIGEHKANIVQEAFEGPATDRVPASYLQGHPGASLYLDLPAAGSFTGTIAPWRLGNIHWTDDLTKRAVLWLCEQTGKALLKLNDEDFRQHDLHQLLRHHGPAQKLAHRVFLWMMDTIEYNPAGGPERKCLCFSPHPDDDVISMGGTLIRLNEDGHETHIAYMTSGNIAVFDHDAMQIADLVAEYHRLFDIDSAVSEQIKNQVETALQNKQPGQPDAPEIQKIKGLIRWSEARAGGKYVGCLEENLHFLDLPFYRTGTINKRPVGDEDIQIIADLLRRVQPDVAFVAGDLADPHGTHRVCAQAILRAIDMMKEAGEKVPEVLLYRGAWQEYALHEIEIAVPLSPNHMDIKRKAIFMHESQKDEALFPGSDPREFWQRAEDRNRQTADSYNQLGLPEYFSMEAFTRWDGNPV
ncbi:Glucosamine-6-phosphate deaminase 1 [Roseimaritima multifibrata]|uniref:Glucosamine-6-phosphate deaminase 1 n=1 Tax=Roseimaritima multifibrata TaxID=1930274 RepID=A0A517MKI7_9BACT|nr:6-phosphogluconolactonase [Roseimaritima multifibrata]QDS95384.1 Glucosamine-6-phosphate deaminase 1 [Roseimaritima multifibrata]